MRLEINKPLKSLNTFGMEARAAYFLELNRPEELAQLWSPELEGLERVILGGGSNILWTRDFPGLVVHIRLGGLSIQDVNDDLALVEAGAGLRWQELVETCLERGLGGLENLSYIPGTVGAAPVQNIGAYGVELQEVFDSLEALDLRTGQTCRLDRAACAFGYRQSLFKQQPGRYVILSVRLRLTRRNHVLRLRYGALEAEAARRGQRPSTIQEVGALVTDIRRSKLPDPAVLGNAGSFFKNPEVDLTTYQALKAAYPTLPGYPTDQGMKLAAGWLIEQAGWKGRRLGRAGVHAQQALVLVNHGGATGAEVLALAQAVQAEVFARFGVRLEPEVNVL